MLDEPYLSIAKKIANVEQLPSWGEVLELFEHFKGITRIGYHVGWSRFCQSIYTHHVFNLELVENLAEEIKKLEAKGRVIEVCAGNGKLSYWLNQFGIPAIATDDYSDKDIKRRAKYVKRLSHREALEKYKPELVIGCWMPSEGLEMDILDAPSVKYYLDIGEGKGGCTGDDRLYERTDITERVLESTTPFSVASSYYRLDTPLVSWAALFTKQ